MNFYLDVIYEYCKMSLYDMLMALDLTVIGTSGGSILGLLLVLAHLTHLEKAGAILRVVAWLARKISLLYVMLSRGTSLFAQTTIWAYVRFPIFTHPVNGILLNGEEASKLHGAYGPLIIGSSVPITDSGAYISEIFRAGIQSIDKGQMEVACSLGLNCRQAMCYVVLPQALRRMLSPLASELIILLKDSLLSFVIGMIRLLAVQKAILGQYPVYEESLYTVALIYLVLTTRLSWMSPRLENYYNQPRH